MDLLIRELEMRDAELILDVFRSDAKLMSRQGTVRCLCEAENYIEKYSTLPKTYTEILVNKHESPSKVILAAVTVQIDRKNRSAFVSYWTHVAHRNRGYATHLVTDLCQRAFEQFDIDRLELMYRMNNPASAVVAKRAGFKVEGIERKKLIMDGKRIDVAICGRLKEDKCE